MKLEPSIPSTVGEKSLAHVPLHLISWEEKTENCSCEKF